MADNNAEKVEAAPLAGDVLDTTKLMDDAAEHCDDLAAKLVHNEDRTNRERNVAELQALSMFRIACALEGLQAEATETLLEEAARLDADNVEPMSG